MLWIQRFPANSEPDDYRVGRVHPIPITEEEWWTAIEAVPGARLGLSGMSMTDGVQFSVEVYDPVAEVWRGVIALVDGHAVIQRNELGDRLSAIFQAAERLVRFLNASIVTEDGIVLFWRDAWQ
jgi:hypothetical protein